MIVIWLCRSVLLIHFLLAFLALHHHQDKLVVGGYQNLVLGRFQPHKLEVVLRVEVSHCIFGLGHQLGDQSGQGVSFMGQSVPYSLRSLV